MVMNSLLSFFVMDLTKRRFSGTLLLGAEFRRDRFGFSC